MRSLLNLFSLKLCTSLLGLIYSVVQVRLFGASRLIEIYFAAQSIIYLITSLTQSGQLSEIFLPEYQRLNKIKKGLGFEGLNIVINRLFVWGTLIITLVFIFTPYIIGFTVPGFSEEDKELTVFISRVLLPYLYFQVLSSFFSTVLNAEKKFGRAEFLGLVNTLLNLIILLFFYSSLGVWALVLSLLLGKLIEFIFYIIQLKKIGFRYNFIFKIPEFDHAAFFNTMKSTLMYVGATQIYSIILTASVSFLPEGIYAIFKYVQNLSNKIRGVFIQPFITIFFTKFSSLVQQSKSVLKEFTMTVQSIIIVNVIIITGGILLSDYVIDFIWGGNKFDKEDVDIAYRFLLFNLLGVLFVGISNIYRKMSISYGLGKKLYSNWVFVQILSAIFSYVLIKYFKINGLFLIIPLNTFLMGIVSFLVYKRNVVEEIEFSFFNKYTVLGGLVIIISFLTKSFITELNYFDNSLYSVIFYLLVALVLLIYPLLSLYKILVKSR